MTKPEANISFMPIEYGDLDSEPVVNFGSSETGEGVVDSAPARQTETTRKGVWRTLYTYVRSVYEDQHGEIENGSFTRKPEQLREGELNG